MTETTDIQQRLLEHVQETVTYYKVEGLKPPYRLLIPQHLIHDISIACISEIMGYSVEFYAGPLGYELVVLSEA